MSAPPPGGAAPPPGSALGPPPPELIAALAAEPLPWANVPSNMLAICITLLIILWISTLSRIWMRFFVLKKPWWDDLAVIVVALSYTMQASAISSVTNKGLGQHVMVIGPAKLSDVLLGQYIWAIGYALSTGMIKVSLLLQYIRVFERGTWDHRFTVFMLVLVALWCFALTFISTFVCFPSPSAFWKMQPRGCYGFAATNINELTGTIKGHSASNFFLDCLILGLAVRLQFATGAQTNKKSMIAILFMGTLACGFALWRLIEIVITGGGVGTDPTWNMPGPAILSQVEVFIGALCATIPFFWPAVRDQWSKIFVSYDFSVSEVRVQDDQYELTKPGSRGHGQAEGWTEEPWAIKDKSGSNTKQYYTGGLTDPHQTAYEADGKPITQETTESRDKKDSRDIKDHKSRWQERLG